MSQNLFVVDASVALAWCFEDESNAYTESILENLKRASAIAPSIWPLEVANVLVVAERRGRVTPAATSQAVSLLQQLPIAIETESLQEVLTVILALARNNQLSVYDASYLHLAMQRGVPLASQDAKLVTACQRNGIPLYRPEKLTAEGDGE